MVRKLVVFLAAAMLTLMPLAAQALGFGSIKLNSALNDPLNAEIQLLSATKADVESLKINLASQDAFLRAGIDRPVFLTKIKFEVKERSSGSFYIHATSRESIREPFINFLLEMSWPSGRMLREYTMLLDPPGHFQKQPTVVQTPQTVQQDQITRQEQPLEEELLASEEVLPEAEMMETEPVEEMPVETAEPETVLAADEVAPADAMTEAPLDEATPMPVLDDTSELPELDEVASQEAEPAEMAEADSMEAEQSTELDPFVDDGTPFPRIALGSYSEEKQPEEMVLGELDYGLTGKNDNAWTIAEKLRQGDDSVSIYQVMMALVQSNPDAFVDGNVHRLKVGHVLRIEDASLLSAMSKKQAARAYQGQTEEWEQYRQSVAASTSRQPIVGSEVSTETVATPESGELILASPGGEELRAGTGTSETAVSSDVVALQDEIRQLRSDAATMRGRNSELNNKLRELENELTRMQRSISIKDDELASLQNQLAELNQQSGVTQAPAPVVVPEPVAEPAPVVTPEPVAKPAPAAKPDVKNPTPVAAPAEPPMEMLDEYLAMAKDVWSSATEIASGMFGSIGTDAMLLYAGAPALVVLLVLMLLIMRRRKKAESNYQESILTGGPNTVNSDETPSTDDSGESSFLSDFAVSGAGAIQTEDSEVDPLTEADVFMAYGRYEAAEERLQEAIQHEPGRKELKVKLLELFNVTKNASAFESTAEDFYASLGGSADGDPMWNKVVAMGKELAPANPLFSGAGAAAAATADTGAFADSFAGDPGVSLSDSQVMDIGLETGVFQSEDFAPAGGSSDLDFNLDLDDSSPAAPAAADDGLDFNLDMGSETAAAPAADAFSADDGLDFNLDMGSETAAAPAADPLSDDGGLDFNLDMGTDSSPTETVLTDALSDAPTDALSDDGGLDFSLDMGDADESPTMETSLSDDGALDFSLDMAGTESEATMAIDTGGLSFDADAAGMELNLDASDATAMDMAGTDEVGTKLDLAKAYIDMGDPDGARSILDEVIDEGNSNQKEEAQQLIQQIA